MALFSIQRLLDPAIALNSIPFRSDRHHQMSAKNIEHLLRPIRQRWDLLLPP